MAFNISYVYRAVDRFTPAANRIRRSVQSTTTQTQALGRTMAAAEVRTNSLNRALGGMGTRVLALGTAIAGATGVKALVDFDHSMSKVLAVSGATESQFIAMRQVAKDLGATTVFSASQAAGGMEFLARAGFKANEVIAAMPGVLDLASSGAIDLATAADIASNVMSGFNMEASQSNKVADLMATITANANTNIQQLGNAMKFVGPIAVGMNQSIEGTTAALGALADAGLQGSMGGTGLRMVLIGLSKPSKQFRNHLVRMGVDLKKINPETNKLVDIMKELEKANLTTSQAIRVFGARGAPAFQVLSNNIPKIDHLNDALENSEGAAKRMADIMRDNLKGASIEAISAFEGLIITIGDMGLTKSLRGLAVTLTSITRGFQFFINTYPKFTALIGISIAVILAAKAALILGTIALKGYVAALIIARNAQLLFNMAMMANPLGVIIGLLAIATAAWFAFRDSIGAAIDSFLALFNMQMPDWLRKVFGMDGVNITANQGSGDMGIVAGTPAMAGRLDGTINVNAPQGVVGSVTSKVSGAKGNLGMSLPAGAY
jgi:TP901 family phage tail tape measure protein